MKQLKNKTFLSKNKKYSKLLYDGMNLPIVEQKIELKISESEAALFKQAENPLGDPDKT